MHIDMPSGIDEVLWAGELESALEAKGIDEGRVRASFGKPHQWPQGQLLGAAWRPPLGGARYVLVRLVFSLQTGGRSVIKSAHFSLHLSAAQGTPVVFDAYPQRQLQENSRPVKLALTPSLKLQEVEASLGGVETTIDFGVAVPVISSHGLSEPTFTWTYTAHPKHPLGEQSRAMFAVVEIPPGVASIDAHMDLIVEAEQRFGPLRLGTPPTEWRKRAWKIERGE